MAGSVRLRNRILGFVGALIVLSVLGSTLSLFRISQVNHSLDGINEVSVPLGRLLSSMQSDGEILHREMERRLGYAHWKDPHWRVQPLPRWILEVLEAEQAAIRDLLSRKKGMLEANERNLWWNWSEELLQGFEQLKNRSDQLYAALKSGNEASSQAIYPQWVQAQEDWFKKLAYGAKEADAILQNTFARAELQVQKLRTGLQIILAVVVLFSILLLWLGERALRPLEEITALARQIKERGLKKEDRAKIPMPSLGREDEVSQLAREFQNMAIALLEREKTVEHQKSVLQEQNQLLREMAALNDRLKQAEHLAAIGRMSAQVAHEVRNPLHSIGLEAEMALELSKKLGSIPLKQSVQSIMEAVERLEKITENYLKLSRLSSGKKQKLNLNLVFERVLAAYESECTKKKIQVEWSLEKGADFQMVGDESLLEQMMGNLFKNAIQAVDSISSESEKPKHIFWKLGNTEKGQIWVQVRDEGPGLSEEVKAKLFAPFITTKAQGTGLGLSFVKQVVDDHQGQIALKTIPGHTGACFEFTLSRGELEKKLGEDSVTPSQNFISG